MNIGRCSICRANQKLSSCWKWEVCLSWVSIREYEMEQNMERELDYENAIVTTQILHGALMGLMKAKNLRMMGLAHILATNVHAWKLRALDHHSQYVHHGPSQH